MPERQDESKRSTRTGGSFFSNREYGVVQGIVLDDSEKSKKILEIFDVDDTDKPLSEYVGHIIVKKKTDVEGPSTFLLVPPFVEDDAFPIVNETVRIISDGGVEYYKRLPNSNINSGNFTEIGYDVFNNQTDESSQNKTTNYKEVSTTGISNSESKGSEIENEYFKPTFRHKLSANEGDKIIQSRFGQSIRFSGYNNEDRELSPTIIIRNRQNDSSLEEPLNINKLIKEDINRDGSTIILSSNKHKMNFQPGQVDDKGNSNWKLDTLYTTLPEEYTGFDQMLLNSERIILSSKSQEMLFFSKGNFSIVSDSELTADISKGGKFDFGDEVWITTNKNNKNIWVNTGNGEVRLNTNDSGNSPGTGQKEPLIRGEKLYEFLDKLLTILENFQSLGFAGLSITNGTPIPPPIGSPEGTPSTADTKTELSNLRATLQDLKSTKNFTE